MHLQGPANAFAIFTPLFLNYSSHIVSRNKLGQQLYLFSFLLLPGAGRRGTEMGERPPPHGPPPPLPHLPRARLRRPRERLRAPQRRRLRRRHEEVSRHS